MSNRAASAPVLASEVFTPTSAADTTIVSRRRLASATAQIRQIGWRQAHDALARYRWWLDEGRHEGFKRPFVHRTLIKQPGILPTNCLAKRKASHGFFPSNDTTFSPTIGWGILFSSGDFSPATGNVGMDFPPSLMVGWTERVRVERRRFEPNIFLAMTFLAVRSLS